MRKRITAPEKRLTICKLIGEKTSRQTSQSIKGKTELAKVPVSRNLIEVEEQELLSRRIADLDLVIKGSRLEPLIHTVYLEMQQAGIGFRPKTYLSDGWGCPDGIPVIGIPFYLADTRLLNMESRYSQVEAENDAAVLKYLRHESGHAFNYAYRFYDKTSFRRLFGRFSLPYNEDYPTIPFSNRFVRHVPGWYAQKHPDDDFAETFAVWLDPYSDWRNRYKDTPVMTKLLFMEDLVRRYGEKAPVVSGGRLHRSLRHLDITLQQWYDCRHNGVVRFNLPDTINFDLRDLFPEKEGLLVTDVFQTNKKNLMLEVNLLTGINRHILRQLMDELIERLKKLDLRANSQVDLTTRISILVTTLAMNYQSRREFISG
jgi:hypothetical protein